MGKLIVTSEVSEPLRQRGIDIATRSISLSRIEGSAQAEDLSEPTNCRGFGRIRHFGRDTAPGWPNNPLPLAPANRFFNATGRAMDNRGRAQVFQNSVCNWRCWYCYVPFSMLKGDPAKSELMPVSDMVDLYLAEPDRPSILDLSGGQPDLTPEWVPWTIQALVDRGAANDVYVWSDDNLSNDFAFRYLSDPEWELMVSHPGYGRVGCFKGFDDASFSFNTGADGSEFSNQFDIFQRLYDTGIDLYAYITLTCPRPEDVDPAGSIRRLFDRLSEIDEHVLLRAVPLQVQVFTPTQPRVKVPQESAIDFQDELVVAWMDELHARFESTELAAAGLIAAEDAR